jgi:branched-chain amino acid transport system ATP-binding protein
VSVAAYLELRDVSVAFGAFKAVNGVSLEVGKGERRAVIGPNGAGKTTLFNAIAGAVPISGGRILLDSRDITPMRAEQRASAGIGRTFQITNLFSTLTVEENILVALNGVTARKFSILSSGRPRAGERQRLDELLHQNNLSARRDAAVETLSYGEQRQLELAVALASSPRVLLLDEPAAGLSPAERVKIAALIRALPRDLTIILIEHDMDLALGLADSVTCLHFGEVLCHGDPDSIRSDARVREIYLGRRHA